MQLPSGRVPINWNMGSTVVLQVKRRSSVEVAAVLLDIYAFIPEIDIN